MHFIRAYRLQVLFLAQRLLQLVEGGLRILSGLMIDHPSADHRRQ